MNLTRVMRFPPESLQGLAVACEASKGRFLSSDIISKVESGEMQLWLAYREKLDGFLLTQILNFPQTKTLRIFCCQSVNLTPEQFPAVIASWIPHLALIEAWAREFGCTLCEIEAPGTWGRVLARNGCGYEDGHVLLQRKL